MPGHARNTIARVGSIEGVGLHTASQVQLRFLPAAAQEGIAFVRVDLPSMPRIPAHIDFVDHNQPRRTVLRRNDAEIQTVEHLLAACAGLGVDDLTIEIDGPEVPGGDGSAMDFLTVLTGLGLSTLDRPRAPLVVRRPVLVEDGDTSAAAVPAPGGGLTISYILEYDNPLLTHQTFRYSLRADSFACDLARARTFCLEEEVAILKKMGFGKGANVENTVVVSPEVLVHGDGLRFDDECARHKVLDLVGDLTLAGAPIEGHIFARKTGHRANHMLVKKILQVACQPESETIDISDIQRILPHRYPFLLVDRIVEIIPAVRAVGVKNVSMNEDFFEGHFPGEPLMPGVLQVEAMAQVAGALLLKSQNYEGRIALILSVEGLRFRKTVRPGDRLVLAVEADKIKPRTAQVQARASVDGETCSEAKFRFMLVDEQRG